MNKKLAVLTAFGAALALTSVAVVAAKYSADDYVYMNSKGQVVGERTYHCSGGSTGWGAVTGNYLKYSYPCQ